jgi:PAS domain S-box-containing protein
MDKDTVNTNMELSGPGGEKIPLRELIDNIPTGICVFGPNNGREICICANRCCSVILGLGPEEFYGTTLEDAIKMVHPEDRERCRYDILDVMERSGRSNGTYRVYNKVKRGYFWLNIIGELVSRPEGGRIAYFTYNDVNDLMNTEKALDQSQQVLNSMIRYIPGGVFVYSADADEKFSFVSENMLTMLGYTRQEFYEKFDRRFSRMVFEDDRGRVLREIIDQTRSGDFDTCTYRIEKKDGTLLWVHDEGHIISDSYGNRWFYVIIVDITLSVKEKNELLNQNNELRELIDSIPASIVVFKKTGDQVSIAAVNTDIRISGSKIVAVSVVHNLDTLIGDIGLKSFGGSGHIYLTRQNGVTICQSKDQEVNSSYNILSYFSTGTMQNLSRRSDSIESVMSAGTSGAFLFTPADSGDGSRKYVAITPVRFTDNTLYLFNVVPQSVVNQTMNEYSRNISVFALIVILLTVLIFVVFFLIYLKRTRRFEADIRSRERLFDLLVAETDNAFMLIYEDDSKPAYFSTNFEEIFKEKDVRIRRSGTGYKLAGTYPAEKNDTLTVINEALAKWDGVQEFVSGYIPYTAHMQERYFRLSLHPVASEKGEFVGIIRDVTPEYNREKSLREALTLADSANRAKTRFLSSVSHDIRTSLNAIINMARFLKQNPSDRENADSELNVIIQSSEHLLSLINDVLDMSRIESGKLSL